MAIVSVNRISIDGVFSTTIENVRPPIRNADARQGPAEGVTPVFTPKQ